MSLLQKVFLDRKTESRLKGMYINPAQKNKDSFQQTILTVRNMLFKAEMSIEKSEILEYVINVIGRELSYDVSAGFLYNGCTPENSDFFIPLPLECCIANGNYSLSGLNVISEPYDSWKLANAIKSVFLKGFHQEYSYYTGAFYPEINLVVVENGRHHLSAATIRNIGTAKLDVYKMENAFPILKTDGAYWYREGMEPQIVKDFRIAVLYELARMKSEFMLPNNPEDLAKQEFTVPISEDSRYPYIQAQYRNHLLELEIGIMNYQIAILKENGSDKPLPEELVRLGEEIQKCKSAMDKATRDGMFGPSSFSG